MADRVNVYEIVTRRIVEGLENGNAIWRKPWRTDGVSLPQNLNSRRPYRGINVFLLGLAGYESPYWVTYDGATKAGIPWTDEAKAERLAALNGMSAEKATEGKTPRVFTEDDLAETQGHVRPGEKGTVIVFWRRYERAAREGEEPTRIDENGRGFVTGATLRYYRVWNAEQCENLKIPEVKNPQEFDPIESASSIIADYPEDMCEMVHVAGDHAYYSPSLDRITLPRPTQFEPREAYYSTAFHESVHATGHESRLNRFNGDVDETTFGSDSYSREELVAEMGASFLCAIAGIDVPQITQNSEAYLKGWLDKIKGDDKLVIQAAGQAQKACDYLLGTTFEEGSE